MFARIALRVVLSVLLMLLILAGVAALGWSAYNAGFAQGIAQNGARSLPGGGAAQPFWSWGGPLYGFWLGPLGCLVPLAVLFLLFALLRPLFWLGMGGHHMGGWGAYGERRKHFRDMAEEWHRQAHAESSTEQAPGSKMGPTQA